MSVYEGRLGCLKQGCPDWVKRTCSGPDCARWAYAWRRVHDDTEDTPVMCSMRTIGCHTCENADDTQVHGDTTAACDSAGVMNVVRWHVTRRVVKTMTWMIPDGTGYRLSRIAVRRLATVPCHVCETGVRPLDTLGVYAR